MKKAVFILLLAVSVCFMLSAAAVSETNGRIKIKVLILPKLETDMMFGDFPGEAPLYYESYLAGGEEYDIKGGYEGEKLYVRDGVALYITGIGKVNAAVSTFAVLSDDRFDFSDAYVISTGCGGSATELSVMGDVAIGLVLKRLGMLNRYIIIRASVNMDVYMAGTTPESLWLEGSAANLESESNVEAADIFPISMENNFKVGKVIIDAILRGQI